MSDPDLAGLTLVLYEIKDTLEQIKRRQAKIEKKVDALLDRPIYE